MPNWCENDIEIISNKYCKLEKIIKKANKKRRSKYEDYGNLYILNAIHFTRESIIKQLGITDEEFGSKMSILYKNFMYRYLNIFDGSITEIKKLFKMVDEFDRTGEYPKFAYDTNAEDEEAFAMKSFFPAPVVTAEMSNINDGFVATVKDKKERSDIMGSKAYDSYWDWTYDTLGTKWDLDSVRVAGMDDLDLDIDPYEVINYDKETRTFSMLISGLSAWGPPMGFMQRLSKKYKVTTRGKYYEPGMMFAGMIQFDKGEETDSDSVDDDIIDCERFMYGDEADFNLLEWAIEEIESDDEEDSESGWSKVEKILKTSKYRKSIRSDIVINKQDGTEIKVKGLFKNR